MSDGAKVEVRGLREISGALRKVDADVQRELRTGLKAIAEHVADEARGRVPHGLTGNAAASIKPRSTNRGAAIAFGGTKAPYFPWLDFGGSTGRGHVSGQSGSGSIKRPWLGKPQGDGRYIYPAIKHQMSNTEQAIGDLVLDVAKKAGFDTHE